MDDKVVVMPGRATELRKMFGDNYCDHSNGIDGCRICVPKEMEIHAASEDVLGWAEAATFLVEQVETEKTAQRRCELLKR